jgi:hypothetical protein
VVRISWLDVAGCGFQCHLCRHSTLDLFNLSDRKLFNHVF